MRKSVIVLGVMVVGIFFGPTALNAASKKAVSKQTRVEEGPMIQVSEEQLQKDMTHEEELKRLGNFGPLHIFGYGELHYNNIRGAGKNQIDFHRMVLGVGYDFNDWIKLNSEVDFEHAFREPELEFAYLDFLFKPWLNFRAGSVLVPMGVLNQHHEPPLFYSVERPELYRVIIPSSWQEGGAGFHGKLPAGFDYELYALSGLEAATIEGATIKRSFTGSGGFHDSFGRVGEQVARDFAASGRLQYKGVQGMRLGTSFFLGNTGQGNAAIHGGFLAMLEGDAKYSFEGIDLEGTLAYTNLSKAGNINTVLTAADPTFSDFVASQMLGWYIEGAYHLFHHLLPNAKQDIVLFSRFESFNTQYRMPGGFAGNPANDRRTMTSGISYLPIPQVAIKADYMVNKNQAGTGADQFNLGLGFYY